MLSENIFPGKLVYVVKYTIFYKITNINLLYSTETQKNSISLKNGSLCVVLSFSNNISYSERVVFIMLPGGQVGYVGSSSLEDIE